MLPSFDATAAESKTIASIARRYRNVCVDLGAYTPDVASLCMDITAVHCNGCRLDLEGLEGASVTDLAHDVAGIVRHIDRRTGRLGGCFSPRYSAGT